ncbi:transcription factor with AP2 domain(s), putative [Plasmodium gallinaceum]|uniref:Transcription factor with AP2 domain(S), putative n=1 Tax=Plasmodium gallinaceum TaxID=5849 RepID=A0A1J1GR60_PLAGA|nr:transcription factor with AP2 domain(s), putative [Plasmodium gallinaceum]CRG94756.1 transcription factor with AP2 domain(s), putative [Plasmodium gallinaceum]
MDEQNDLKIQILNEELIDESKIIEKNNIIKEENSLNRNDKSNNSDLTSKENLKELICKKEIECLESTKKDNFHSEIDLNKKDENNVILNNHYLEKNSINDSNNKNKDDDNDINNVSTSENYNNNLNYIGSISFDQNKGDSNMDISRYYNKENIDINQEKNHKTSLFLEKNTSNINNLYNFNDSNHLYNIKKLSGENDIQNLSSMNEKYNDDNKTVVNESNNVNIENDENAQNSNEYDMDDKKKTNKYYLEIKDDNNKEEVIDKEKINKNIDNHHMSDYSRNTKKEKESICVENTEFNNSINGYNNIYNKINLSNKKEENLKSKKKSNNESKDEVFFTSTNMRNYKNGLENCSELNNFTKKRAQMEIFLHNQINCYDMLLEIHKRIPLWGEYEANFFFHWRKIMTLNNEELKIYILIFRSLSIETIKHLDFYILKIIIGELDELRKVHEPNYNPFIFTEDYIKNYDLTFQKSSDIYVNMNEFMQPWYVRNNNKSLDIKKFLNSLDILENQKQRSYIIQAMEIPSHIFEMCNGTNKEEKTEKIEKTDVQPEINKTSKKVKKDNAKKRENNKIKNLKSSINSRPKKRTGYYALEIDGVIASFEARKGVYYDKSRKLWRANWKENGKIQTKGFSVNEYKSVQLARQKAIEWREKKEAELLL